MQTQLSPDVRQAIERLAEQNGLTMSQLIQQLQSDYRTLDYRRRFFDLSLDLFCVVNYDGIIQHVNPAFINTTGYPESALVGREVMDFYHADDIERATQSARALREGEQLQSLDLRFRIADGSYRWLNWTARPEADDLIYATARDITETVILRERVEARDRRISNIMTNISDAFFAIDREWRFIYLNPEAERALQRTREELIGKNIWDEFPQAVDGPFYTHYQRVMHDGEVSDFTEYYPPFATWFDVRAYPIPEGIAVYFQDVTEQMHAEQETQRQKLHIEMALDAANMGVWSWDVAQDQIQWSPEVLKIFGVDENSTDLDQAQYMSFIHPDDVETFQAALDAVLEDPDNNFYTTVHRIITPMNTERWIYGEGKLYHDENGDPSFLLGVVKDITEQKKTEDALRESEERYRSVVQGQSELICRYTPDFNITFVNEAYTRYMGRTYDDVIGTNLLEMIPEDDREAAVAHVRALTADQPTATSIHRSIMADGRQRWFEWTDRAIVNTQGIITEYQGVGRDITKSKQIEDVLYFVAQRGWEVTDNTTFLNALTRYLTDALDIDYALVGVVDDAQTYVDTLALAFRGETLDNVSYQLAGTPCHNLMTREFFVRDDHVQAEFPDDVLLQQMSIRGYMGITLWDANKQAIGILVLMCRERLTDIESKQTILRVVAMRAAHEIEQERANRTLRESEERYRKVVTAMAEGIVVHRLDGTIKTANQQACAILGLTHDQLLGRTSLDPRWRSVHEDGTPFPGEMHPAMVTLRTGESQHNTIMGVHKPNGTLSWISINSEPILDADTQELQGAIASFNDITQRKIAQEQIIASEKRFRSLVESAPVGILLVSIQGQIISANPMIGRIFGYSSEHLQQFTVEDLIPHDRRHTHIGLRQSYHQTDGSRLMGKGILVEGLRADGTRVPLEVALNNVIIDGEKVTIAFVSDITIRKQAEAMERETTTLRLKLEKEKELNELKNSFITIVSHEFRTPMTIIMSSVALLRRYGDRLSAEKREQRLAKIDTQIQRLTTMMDEIVRISQDDVESYRVRPEALQIDDFISQILEELHVQHEKDFQALVHHHHDTMTIYEDDALLHQICLNIISNAVKYSPEQSIITIETRMTADTWEFSVRDRGIGIPTADQEKLFTLFYRGSNVDNIAGTGLGLVIVQQAVETLNGSINFESSEGEGTTFTVILPRRPYDSA